ncbi:MAG: hypothetical protein BZY82_10195 [SAR202 cluster bacterium Io17-Chloro-G3]|nr:MAG: hypothetical protein BZY82_10195 [SAR202 cluster bacterium Io17-Chloro-G3]
MDIQSGSMVALILGLLLGLKHATDADHVVAVSTIVGEYRNVWKGIWVGVSWGLGHTTPLLVLGLVILLMKEAVLDWYQGIEHFLEAGVGIMLVFLGLQVFWKLYKGNIHFHDHSNEADPHLHIHTGHAEETDRSKDEAHGIFNPGKPFFRLKSFVIGVVHGLAGSAAVMLVLLPEIDVFWVGVGYLLLFGLGTILSMSVITLLLGVPFAASGNFERLNKVVGGLAGSFSILFGVALISDLLFHTTLIPF